MKLYLKNSSKTKISQIQLTSSLFYWSLRNRLPLGPVDLFTNTAKVRKSCKLGGAFLNREKYTLILCTPFLFWFVSKKSGSKGKLRINIKLDFWQGVGETNLLSIDVASWGSGGGTHGVLFLHVFSIFLQFVWMDECSLPSVQTLIGGLMTPGSER